MLYNQQQTTSYYHYVGTSSQIDYIEGLTTFDWFDNIVFALVPTIFFLMIFIFKKRK